MNELVAHFCDQIQTISKDEWNALTGIDYPFLRYEFLAALEDSGSVSEETGWIPQHLALRNSEYELIALAPCYLKDHSYGEYVFDWSWANAYYEHRLEYYPKLLTAIPFTPSVGPRLSVRKDVALTNIHQLCIHAIIELCHRHELSSWHLLFPHSSLIEIIDAEIARENLPQLKLMKRVGMQFHWYNQGYSCFADYLGAMKSRKRKSIRKEREKVAQQGITFLHVGGEEISEAQLDDYYIFYHATYMKRGQHGYLNRSFFELLIETMPENLHFVFAQKNGRNVATALFLLGGDTLYGRYWGCLEEYDQLHFETCYYQGIDVCIEQNLSHFDAGAQGEHKIQRGFEPIATYSYHWIAHPAFRDAIQDFLDHEQAHIFEYIEDAKSYLPFKQTEQ